MNVLRTLPFLVLLACGGSSSSTTESTTPEPVPVSTVEIPPGTEHAPVDVTLLDPGEPPRTPLRMRARPSSQGVRMELDMRLGMRMGPMESPMMDIPTTVADFAMEITDVGADGIYRTTSHVTGLEVRGDTPLAQQVATQLEPLRRLRTWTIHDPQGRLLAMDQSIEEPVPNTMRQTLDSMTETLKQLTPPFPGEPVGVGARWRTVSNIEGQLRLRQTATYALRSLSPEEVVLTIEVEQDADPQPMPVQPGVEASLRELESAGRGEVTLRLDATRFSSVSSMQLAMIADVEASGQAATEMHMNMEAETRIQPLDR